MLYIKAKTHSYNEPIMKNCSLCLYLPSVCTLCLFKRLNVSATVISCSVSARIRNKCVRWFIFLFLWQQRNQFANRKKQQPVNIFIHKNI